MPEIKEKDNQEISNLVKETVYGAIDELTEMIPTINFQEPIPDAKIKKAILDVTPEGMKSLFRQFGRDAVLQYIADFSRGRDF